MNLHIIAGLAVDLSYKYDRLRRLATPYRIDRQLQPNISVNLSDSILGKLQAENPNLTLEQCEYIWTGSLFYEALTNFNGFMLHSSAVVVDSRAYLFSAPSGVGKSTHTELWLKHFGSRAVILNDDKPAIRINGDEIAVYGTPWSGKSDLNINMKAELGGICILERAETNFINKIPGGDAIAELLNQTIRPADARQMGLLLNTLDTVITHTPVYKMGCTISEEAAVMAYEAMSKK